MSNTLPIYELLKSNNNWTIGTNNSVLNIISNDASINNLNIENCILNNNKTVDEIILEDNSNNKLLNFLQISNLIKTKIIDLSGLVNSNNEKIIDLSGLVNSNNEKIIDLSGLVNNNNEKIIDLSGAHYTLRSEFDVLDGSAVRVETFNDLSGAHYTLRSEFDVLDGSAVRVEKFNDLSSNYYNFRSTYNSSIVIDSENNLTIPNDLHITKNLVVDGSFVYLNTIATSITDPVIDLGLDASLTPLTSSDTNDRGLKLNYYNGSKSNSAFMGFITSSSESSNTDYYNKFVFLNDISYNNNKIVLNDSSLATIKADKFEGQLLSSSSTINSLTSTSITTDSLSVTNPLSINNLISNDASLGSVDISENINIDGQLLISGTTNASPLIKVIRTEGSNDVMQVLDSNSNDSSIFKIANDGNITIAGDLYSATGEIKLGTSTKITPTSLELNGDMSIDNGNIEIQNSNNTLILPSITSGNGNLIFGTTSKIGGSSNSNTLSFITNNGERVRISDSGLNVSSGSLSVGGTSVALENTSSLTNYSLTSDLYTKAQLESGNLDLSFQNVDVSGSLNVLENINLNNSNTFINVLNNDNSSNKVINLQQNMGMLNEYFGEKTNALIFMNDITTVAETYHEVSIDNTITINNGVNNFIVDTSYISFIDISNYGDSILEIYCNCDASTNSASADNYIKFDLSAVETVTNNTLQVVDIDTRSVTKGYQFHMGFGSTCYKLMNTTNGTDFTKSIDFNNKYVLRLYSGIEYELIEIKLYLKVKKLNY